ncbi:MAG: flagellar hook-length control protein FliK [Caldilineaceae bacterium]|nr:flagellar hook-length control protein FliK [Caldilineaceae bacterium]
MNTATSIQAEAKSLPGGKGVSGKAVVATSAEMRSAFEAMMGSLLGILNPNQQMTVITLPKSGPAIGAESPASELVSGEQRTVRPSLETLNAVLLGKIDQPVQPSQLDPTGQTGQPDQSVQSAQSVELVQPGQPDPTILSAQKGQGNGSPMPATEASGQPLPLAATGQQTATTQQTAGLVSTDSSPMEGAPIPPEGQIAKQSTPQIALQDQATAGAESPVPRVDGATAGGGAGNGGTADSGTTGNRTADAETAGSWTAASGMMDRAAVDGEQAGVQGTTKAPTSEVTESPVVALDMPAPQVASAKTVTASSIASPLPATPTDQIVEQVQVNLVRGENDATIQLNPKDLGSVRIRLQMEDGQLHLSIRAEQPDTGRLLNSKLADLRQSLESQGIKVGELAVARSERVHSPEGAGREIAPAVRSGQMDMNPNDSQGQRQPATFAGGSFGEGGFAGGQNAQRHTANGKAGVDTVQPIGQSQASRSSARGPVGVDYYA